MPIKDFKKPSEFINLNNSLIADNITHRREWEEDCEKVELSYKGNKFPVKDYNRVSQTLSSTIKRSTEKKAMVNLVKRQWRVISNYLLNNEPQFLITEKTDWTNDQDITETREVLDKVFDWGQDENAGFYDTVMDDTIYYGIFRGIGWTMIYFDEERKQFAFKAFDSMDTYIDLWVDRLSEIRKFVSTYNIPREDLKRQYQTDTLNNKIDWDNIDKKTSETTASDVKKSMIIEKQWADTALVREGYYLEDKTLWRVKTLETIFLSHENLGEFDFLPVTYYAPQAIPGEIYPRGWFSDMIEIEREINLLFQKLSTIIKTWWRFVYVKAGTIISKSTNNVLNSLGIEVFEYNNAQDIPKQATLLQISQSDIEYLNILLQHAEDEGWMKSDIMGTSSTGSNASWRAIQALQAGSKNNIGWALNELNKYMNRLVRILLRMFKIYGSKSEYFSSKLKKNIEVNERFEKLVDVKVSITGRDAFDEVTKQMNAIDILNMIQKFDPETKIPPMMITKIMGVTNDIAEEIQEELDKQENPDLQIAEGQAKKMLQWIPQPANENDNHQVFIAIFSEALKTVEPDSPAWECLLKAIRMHDAFLQSGSGWNPPPWAQ